METDVIFFLIQINEFSESYRSSLWEFKDPKLRMNHVDFLILFPGVDSTFTEEREMAINTHINIMNEKPNESWNIYYN